MIRFLFSRIAALWRPAATPPRTRRDRAAPAKSPTRGEGMMEAHWPAAGTAPGAEASIAPGAEEYRPVVARGSSDDLLARAMISLNIDCERLSAHDSAWLQQMRLTCRSCTARSRCRRDLGTGDFARRYRHYCANAESLALLAAAELSDDARKRKEH